MSDIQVISSDEAPAPQAPATPVHPAPSEHGSTISVDSLTERGKRAKARAKANVDRQIREETRAALQRQADAEKELAIQAQLRALDQERKQLEMERRAMEIEAKQEALLVEAKLAQVASNTSLVKANLKDRQQQEHDLIDSHVDRLVETADASTTEDQLFKAAEEVSMIRDTTNTSASRPASPTTSTPARPSRPPRALSPLVVVRLPPATPRREETPEARVTVLPLASTITTSTTTAPRMSTAPLTSHTLPFATRPALVSSDRREPIGDSANTASGQGYTQAWVNDLSKHPPPPLSNAYLTPPVTTAGIQQPNMSIMPFNSATRDEPPCPYSNPPDRRADRDEYLDRLAAVHNVPKEEVPMFSGDPREYPEFIATFQDVVEKAVREPAKKFRLLKGKLKGKAREAVEHLFSRPHAEAFQPAMAALHKEFGTPSGIVNFWLVELAKGKFSSVNQYCRMLRAAYEAIEAAKSLHVVDNRAIIVQYSDRLPLDLRKEWAKKVPEIESKTPLTFKHLVDFVTKSGLAYKDDLFGEVLRKHANPQAERPSQATTHPHKRPRTEKTRPAPRHDRPQPNPAKERRPPTKKAPSPIKVYATQEVSIECSFCRSPHDANKCPALTTRHRNVRLNLIQQAGLCFVCLRAGHMATECRSAKRCGVDGCKGRHATMLHGVEWPKRDQGEGKGEGKGLRVNLPPKGSRKKPAAETVSKASVEGDQA